ncbi:MAG: hypothetical protein B7X35_02360 [Halothiobacillus sp. 14-56-357]|jgi:hypothetical protein|uniref:hypothetical protein n=1 Tax=Halothiobacillus sp. 15-55-196 TaxID=1970382 RepID=UPI000BCAFE46|nr:hypothetical protein [Halothiobacillus sp. 15-55-196]OZB37809.1 MAG: hypothetical protein B7X44_00470 [Halothiobacillus sp. 15-55-196]OZB57188.1 MAG: hypothetical protein B7X35_02360 [Halothiobacillus sp. 14-56-357]OZB78743.1 MAG: hypothetical protein B7X29_03675 [Halothiobacillus sp. 13-55-115]
MDIKKTIRLLDPFLIEGVLSAKKISHARVVEMLHQLDFTTDKLEQDDDAVTIKLRILDDSALCHLLSGEANKFFLASRVSYERSTQNQLNNASWQAIENYYSAYYSVHYLLRLTGVSLTNIDGRSAKSIERGHWHANLPFSVPTGLYVMNYDSSSAVITLTKNKRRKSGGSHQDAWKLWVELVEKLSAQTNTDLFEYARIDMDLTEHKRFLVRSSSKYNPPEIRGEINYQFKGGSWIFEQKSAASIGVLQRKIAATGLSPISSASTPENLLANNMFIISLANAVFVRASERYPKGICRSLSNKY